MRSLTEQAKSILLAILSSNTPISTISSFFLLPHLSSFLLIFTSHHSFHLLFSSPLTSAPFLSFHAVPLFMLLSCLITTFSANLHSVVHLLLLFSYLFTLMFLSYPHLISPCPLLSHLLPPLLFSHSPHLFLSSSIFPSYSPLSAILISFVFFSLSSPLLHLPTFFLLS